MTALPVLGEPLALELANTLVGAGATLGAAPEDLLRSRADVDRWIAAHAERLPVGAVERPPAIAALRGLRDAIRALVGAAVAGGAPDPAAVAVVNAAAAAAPPRPQLVWAPGGEPEVVDAAAARLPQATLAAIARSAVELLGGPQGERLRRCEGPGCVLVFVAAHPRRRWCSAATCGNRVRVARHYARHRDGGGAQ